MRPVTTVGGGLGSTPEEVLGRRATTVGGGLGSTPGEVLGRRATTIGGGRGSARGSMSRMARWISSMLGRAAGSAQQDCMSSHIFELRPTAAVPGCSGGVLLLRRTGR